MSRVKEFKLPDLGEGLTEGEILAWLVKVGDTIELNQPIVEVETAKAAVEIPAKWAGQVTRIFHEAGTTVEVGSPIIAIDTDPGAGPAETTTGPSAASLAAVEIAPAEGAVEPGLIGGPAPGGRTAVLVGYGPKTADGEAPAAQGRRSGPTGAASAAPRSSAERRLPCHSRRPSRRPAAATAPASRRRCWPSRRYASSPRPRRRPARSTGTGPQGSITREDVQAALSGTGRQTGGGRRGRQRGVVRAGPRAARSRSRACAS